MFKKRGSSNSSNFWIFLIVLFIIFILLVMSSIFSYFFPNLEVDTSQTSIFELLAGQNIFPGVFLYISSFILGGISTQLITASSISSGIIITISIWFLIFLTFGDIISTFGTFSDKISWSIAFFLTLIAANLDFIVYINSYLLGIFLTLGSFAVIAGLASAFVAFLLVNFGVKGAGSWIIRRKMMQEAVKASITSEAKGVEVAGTIKGLEKIGEAFSKSD